MSPSSASRQILPTERAGSGLAPSSSRGLLVPVASSGSFTTEAAIETCESRSRDIPSAMTACAGRPPLPAGFAAELPQCYMSPANVASSQRRASSGTPSRMAGVSPAPGAPAKAEAMTARGAHTPTRPPPHSSGTCTLTPQQAKRVASPRQVSPRQISPRQGVPQRSSPLRQNFPRQGSPPQHESPRGAPAAVSRGAVQKAGSRSPARAAISRSPGRRPSSEGSSPSHSRSPTECLAESLSAPQKAHFEELQFTETLGSGEFGQVFRGTFRGSEVAIKKLFVTESTTSEALLKEMAKEIESFRHLRHKRLLRFYAAVLEMPNPCLITEYMPGGSLHHLLHVRKLRLPWLHAMNMCLQVADALMYLHSQVPIVVHRDIKSLNVLLDLSLNIKICDFGLTESMEHTHMAKKNNGGSPRYMAPELFDSETKLTEKIDVWAMGCLFIEIFAGPLPYEHISSLADLTREMFVHKRVPEMPRDLPEEISKIIRGCLDFDYRLRLSSSDCFEQLKSAKKHLRDAGVL